MKPLVYHLGAGSLLAARLAAHMGAEPGTLEIRAFPDGETYLRIGDDCSGRPVVLLCSLDRPNDKVVPLLLTVETLRDLGATTIGLAAPYLAYMRQDKRFHAGEGVTARYFAQLLSRHFDWLVTIDPHLHRFHRMEALYSIPALAVHAAPVLAQPSQLGVS